MRRVGRLAVDGTLLALLVSGAVYGVVMVIGFAVMIVGVGAGWMPMPEPTVAGIAFGLLMVLVWGGMIVSGLAALARHWRRTRELDRAVCRDATPPSSRLATAAARAGCADPVVEVPAGSPYAFTYRIWRPRIVVSTGLLDAATDEELVAVLRHEDYHVRHRDPLKVLALRSWSAAFFVVPLVGALFQRVLDRQEIKADRAAIRTCGVTPVAGALLKAVGEPDGGRESVLAAIGGASLLEERIAQLETGRSTGGLAAIRPQVLRSVPGIGLIGLYGVLVYQVCMAAVACCVS